MAGEDSLHTVKCFWLRDEDRKKLKRQGQSSLVFWPLPFSRSPYHFIQSKVISSSQISLTYLCRKSHAYAPQSQTAGLMVLKINTCMHRFLRQNILWCLELQNGLVLKTEYLQMMAVLIAYFKKKEWEENKASEGNMTIQSLNQEIQMFFFLFYYVSPF